MTTPDSADMLMDNNGSLAAAISPSSPTPQQQKQIIQDLTNNSISKPGNSFFLVSDAYSLQGSTNNYICNSYFLVSNRWYTGWKKYVGFGTYPCVEVLPEPHLIISDAADRPGPIDNSNIVAAGSNSEVEDLQLLDNLKEERDYVVVSQDVWEKLFEWYKGGPVLPRKMISVRVVVCSNPLAFVNLDGFTSSDTINVIVDRLSQVLQNIDLGYRDCGKMLSPDGLPMDYNETLQSLLDLGYGDWSTYLCYIPCYKKKSPIVRKLDFNWLSICERVRLREEAHMENIGNPVSIIRRPKSIQFAQLPGLGIHGRYELLDSNNNSVPDTSISFAASVRTNAAVILLAPNDKILKDLISLNGKSKYLVVGVTWDILSYLFLRKLRASYPDIPIVAVTDLDPHHLDLLTFLDTSLVNLPCCYGWDLSTESRYENNIDSVNIKWLGLRPCDCKYLPFDGANRYPSGFREVIHMLRANPFFRSKKPWLAALDWLDVFGKSVTFHPLRLAPGGTVPDSADCHVFLGDSFVAKKLFKKEWV